MENNSSSFTSYLRIIMKWRRVTIRNVLIVTVAALIISFIVRPKFTAVATVLPPSAEEGTFAGLSGMMSAQAAFSTSLSRLGFSGLTRPSDLFAAILKSGRIKGEIINRFDLKTRFKAKTMHDAQKALKKITKINVTPEGIIEVSVTHR
ncbi:MAG: Wzz/FepE/Etk N-terminal domain-containing protein, partial [bacterium]